MGSMAQVDANDNIDVETVPTVVDGTECPGHYNVSSEKGKQKVSKIQVKFTVPSH